MKNGTRALRATGLPVTPGDSAYCSSQPPAPATTPACTSQDPVSHMHVSTKRVAVIQVQRRYDHTEV